MKWCRYAGYGAMIWCCCRDILRLFSLTRHELFVAQNDGIILLHVFFSHWATKHPSLHFSIKNLGGRVLREKDFRFFSFISRMKLMKFRRRWLVTKIFFCMADPWLSPLFPLFSVTRKNRKIYHTHNFSIFLYKSIWILLTRQWFSSFMH